METTHAAMKQFTVAAAVSVALKNELDAGIDQLKTSARWQKPDWAQDVVAGSPGAQDSSWGTCADILRRSEPIFALVILFSR
jgi:hypothetical protein